MDATVDEEVSFDRLMDHMTLKYPTLNENVIGYAYDSLARGDCISMADAVEVERRTAAKLYVDTGNFSR